MTYLLLVLVLSECPLRDTSVIRNSTLQLSTVIYLVNMLHIKPGMLGAQNEFTEDSDLFRLALESRECFPELCETLQDETGIDIQYQASGLIKIANQIDDVAHLRSQFQFYMHSITMWLNFQRMN